MIGSTLSHYKVLDELGRGGMGIVYKAEDTSLDRTVALKVLPSAALASSDDRARFYREAKAAAQLHHPHIATVFQIDEAVPSDAPHGTEPSPFIAMEYIEGETLDARIKRGPVKLPVAVRVATEMAEALKAAHAKDIVHRDIKSGNVMLDASGTAKVLDFGLAKTSQSTKLTRMGSTLGTAAYMSPEQARGEDLDQRSDLWSLGVVLYEMIAGRPPFATEYEQAAMYSILNEDPEPLTAVRTGVSMDLERIVQKCLMKDKTRRYQHADDLIADLKGVSFDAATTTSVTAIRPGPSVPQEAGGGLNWKMAGIAFVALIAGVAGTLLLVDTGSTERTSIVGAIPLVDAEGNTQTIPNSDRRSLDISPDGSKVVFIGGPDYDTSLYLRNLSSETTTLIPGTNAPGSPTFSPDGSEIAYCTDQWIMKVPTGGGRPTQFASVVTDYSCAGLAWLSDRSIVVAPDRKSGLWLIAADGSDLRQITFPDSVNGDISHRWPRALPDHSGVTFAIKTDDMESLEEAGVAVYDMKSGDVKLLFRGGTDPMVTFRGNLLYAKEEGLFAVAYDASRTEVTGEHRLIQAGVGMRAFSGEADYGLTRSGTFVFLKSEATPPDFVEVVRDGMVIQTIEPSSWSNQIKYSPNGTKVVIETPAANNYVSVIDLQTETVTRLTFRFNSRYPMWTPDGQWITFLSDRMGDETIYRISPDGGEAEKVVTLDKEPGEVSAWSPDGNELFFMTSDPETLADVWKAVRGEPWHLEPVLRGPYNEGDAVLSADGSMLAYVSDETGTADVFVVQYPELNGRRRISRDGGWMPTWTPDGRSVVFRTTAALEVADVERAGDGISVSSPRPYDDATVFRYDLNPDGRGYVRISGPVGGAYRADNPDILWFITDFPY